MKKIITMCILLSLVLTACGKVEEKEKSKNNINTLKGTILSIEEDGISILPDIEEDQIKIIKATITEKTTIMNLNKNIISNAQLYENYIVEITYNNNEKENIPENIEAIKINVIDENISKFIVENVTYDEDWNMYKGNCTEGSYEGELLFSIPENFNITDISENSKIEIESTGGMTMSLPPQLFGIVNITIIQ